MKQKYPSFIILISFFSIIFMAHVTHATPNESPIITKITDFGDTSIYASVYAPTTINELKTIIINNHNKKIAIAGTQYSQGGQTIGKKDGEIVIDMKKLNKIISLDLDKKQITVEPGATWHAIQEHIIPHNLAVTAMQSYNEFTVGGSISVNAHGRDTQYSTVGNSVISLEILLANGELITTSRTQNPDLFKGIIGGYGWLGIITKATLQLTDNIKLERSIYFLPANDYEQFYEKMIHNNPNIVLHNANIYPSDFTKICSTAWKKTNNSLTIKKQMQNKNDNFYGSRITEVLVRYIPLLKQIRIAQEAFSMLGTPVIVWRNYEMSYVVKSLAASLRHYSTTILQEYFVPKKELSAFIAAMKHIVNTYNINVLNVSIRYVPADTISILSYAPQDSFAFVMYINIPKDPSCTKQHKIWTQELIDAALALGGTYYLPYHLWARQDQFDHAYPGITTMKKLKNQYDPTHMFSNQLFDTYTA